MKQVELEETTTPVVLQVAYSVYFITIGIVYGRAFIAGVSVLAKSIY